MKDIDYLIRVRKIKRNGLKSMGILAIYFSISYEQFSKFLVKRIQTKIRCTIFTFIGGI